MQASCPESISKSIANMGKKVERPLTSFNSKLKLNFELNRVLSPDISGPEIGTKNSMQSYQLKKEIKKFDRRTLPEQKSTNKFS